jgi:sugar lactone lactonase YvrE
MMQRSFYFISMILALTAAAPRLGASSTFVYVDGAGNSGDDYLFTYSGGTLLNTAGSPSPADLTAGQIAVSPNGNLYIVASSASGGFGIDEFNSAGQYVGQYMAPTNSLVNPVGLAWGPDGNLYIADESTGAVYSFDGTNLNQVIAAGPLSDPVGLTFGPNGDLYIANVGSSTVYQWDGTNLTQFTPVGVESGEAINDLVFGPDGNLYVTGTGNGDILEFNGTTGSFIGDYGNSASSPIDQPTGLAFAPDGSLYVADAGGVEVFDPSGNFVDQLIMDSSSPGPMDTSEFLTVDSVTPEPATYGMVMIGIAGLGIFRLRLSRKRRA